jgi:hypothetical protein
MTNYKQIISEINRVNELMGTRLITEQRVDKILKGFIGLSNNQKINTKISNLLAKESLTISDVKTLFNTLKNTKGTNKSILDRISSVEKSIVDKSNSPSYINKINSGLYKGLDEDEIMNDILLDMRKKYGTFMDDDKILDAFTSNISKKIDDLKSVKPTSKPEPKPEENFSKQINNILPNFTKFVGDRVDEMGKIAKNVNDNVNKLKQGGLTGDQIKEIEKSILKDMQKLYYTDRDLIVNMEKEITQGLKSTDKKIKDAFQHVKKIMDDLSPTTEEGLRWKSGKVAKEVTPNRWGVFIKETLKSGFSDYIYLLKLFKKNKKVQQTLENIEKISNVDSGGLVDDSIQKASQKLSGSLVLPNWKRQLWMTFIGSPRGVPIKGSKQDAYEAIITAFPKGSMTAARASLIIEKIIRIIKLTITLEVLVSLLQGIRDYKFYLVGTEYYEESKRIQKTYSECIDEISKKLDELKKRPSDMELGDYPECFITLMKSDKITDKELGYIVERAYFDMESREIIPRFVNALNITESTWKFIVSSRVRISVEIADLWTNYISGVKTGDFSRIDEYIEGITSEVSQLRSEIRPIQLTDEPPQEIIEPQQGSSSTQTTTTQTTLKPIVDF